MSKCCGSLIRGCEGETKRFMVHSGEYSAYPNRYWGVSDYCSECARAELESGFVLTEVSNERELVTL